MQFIHIFDLKSNKLTFTFILLDDGNIDSQPYISYVATSDEPVRGRANTIPIFALSYIQC